VVTDASQAEATAERFRRYIEAPVLTDVRVGFSGFAAYDVEPVAQADLFAERPIVVFGKWRGARTGQIELSGRTGTGEFKVAIDVAKVAAHAEHAALPQLWARTRIARLSDFVGGEEATDVERQVTELGLRYSLLTKYTSFIAVLQQVRNPDAAAVDVDQPLALPEGVAELADGAEYNSGAEPELLLLATLLALGAAVSAWRRKSAAARSCL
jgi:Ca-activated chloride channel family protein